MEQFIEKDQLIKSRDELKKTYEEMKNKYDKFDKFINTLKNIERQIMYFDNEIDELKIIHQNFNKSEDYLDDNKYNYYNRDDVKDDTMIKHIETSKKNKNIYIKEYILNKFLNYVSICEYFNLSNKELYEGLKSFVESFKE